MQSRIWIILIVVSISCNSDSNNKKSEEITDLNSIEKLEKNGFQIFQESPQKAISIFKQVAINYEKQKNLKKAGLVNLNIANIYDEYSNEIDSALIYSNKSLKIWERQDDTLQIANLYKYIGLLKGKRGEFKEAKLSILKAIKLYTEKEFEQGVAVSEFNLADLYFREKEFKECELLLNKSIEFWKKNGDYNRVFTNNILGIKLYSKIGNDSKVQKLIKENIEIRKENKLNDFIKNKFNELIKEINKTK